MGYAACFFIWATMSGQWKMWAVKAAQAGMV